jgi:hypothetical protein
MLALDIWHEHRIFYAPYYIVNYGLFTTAIIFNVI